MHESLTIDERTAIRNGRWFSSLSPSLQREILQNTYVKRFKDGDLVVKYGDSTGDWMACAKGAVYENFTSLSGKQFTLNYLEAGEWFGDINIFDWDFAKREVYAIGESAILCMISLIFIKY